MPQGHHLEPRSSHDAIALALRELQTSVHTARLVPKGEIEVSQNRKNKRGRKPGDWLDAIRPASERVQPQALNMEDFDLSVDVLLEEALKRLTQSGRVDANVLGFDAHWRPVHLYEGKPQRSASWSRVGGQPFVAIPGPLMDNLSLIRAVFERLHIQAAVLVSEVWMGLPSPDSSGLPSVVRRSQAFGRSEALAVDAFYPAVDYQRVVIAPMVRMGDSVTASVLMDSGDPDCGIQFAQPALAACFSHRQRIFRM